MDLTFAIKQFGILLQYFLNHLTKTLLNDIVKLHCFEQLGPELYSLDSMGTTYSFIFRSQIIGICNGCDVWIENSVTMVTFQHHEAFRVMPNTFSE